jgi:hypothetical protein
MERPLDIIPLTRHDVAVLAVHAIKGLDEVVDAKDTEKQREIDQLASVISRVCRRGLIWPWCPPG